MKKSFGIILLVLVLLLACGIGALTYFYMNQDARINKIETKVDSLESNAKIEKNSKTVEEENIVENEVEEPEENEVEEPENQETESEYTFESIAGVYDIKDDESGLKNQLILYKDGTFTYAHGKNREWNYSGNYVISGSKILMNVWFKIDKEEPTIKDCFKTNESFEMSIKTNGKSIVDSNDFDNMASGQNETYSIKLTKSSNETTGDINEIIYSYIKDLH